MVNKKQRIAALLIGMLVGVSTIAIVLFQSFDDDDSWDYPENNYDSKFETYTRWAGDWIVNTIQDSGMFRYEYYIGTNSYSSNYNYLRHWGTAFSLISLFNKTGDVKYRDAAVKTFDWGLKYYYEYTSDPNIGFLYYSGKSNSGGAALALMALTQFKSSVNVTDANYEKYDDYIYKLGNFLLWAQQPEGWIRSNFLTGVYQDYRNNSYYPSESMLALALLYKLTRNEIYSNALSKAFNFYSNLSLYNWRDSAFMPWTAQAFSELFFLTGNVSYAQYVFDLSDWKISGQWLIDKYDEYGNNLKGGMFSNPTISTSSTLEGIGDAYRVAQILNDTYHINKYNKSLVLGMEFLLSLQVRREKSELWGLSSPQRAFGGFYYCHTCSNNNSMRIDYTQHSLIAMIKVWKYMPEENILSINYR